MAITKRVQTQLSNVLPSEPRATLPSRSNQSNPQAELVPAALAPPPADTVASTTTSSSSSNTATATQEHNSTHQRCDANCSSKGKTWTPAEHERFVQALQLFPADPWKAIAAVVGTKTSRQTMTHAQKCRQKLERRQRGLKIQTRRLVESRQQQQQRLFPSREEESSNRLQPLPVSQESPHRDVSSIATQENALMDRFLVVAHPAINRASRDDAGQIHAKSHVTSMTSTGAGADDARHLTLSWGDARGRAQEQQQHSHGSMETVSDFAVLGAFESTHSSSMMWGEGSRVSSMGLLLPVIVDAEELCVFSTEVVATLTDSFSHHQLRPDT